MFQLNGRFDANSVAMILEEQAKMIKEVGTTEIDISIRMSVAKGSKEGKSLDIHQLKLIGTNDYDVRLSDSEGKNTDLELSLAGDITQVKEQILLQYPNMKVSYIFLKKGDPK